MKRLSMDMAELCMAFESQHDDSSWVLDTETDAVDDEDLSLSREEIANDETGRFLFVEPQESHEAYGDMEELIATVRDARLKDLLEVAIQGKGAFRRFKDVLCRSPAERERWFAFSEGRGMARVREWLVVRFHKRLT